MRAKVAIRQVLPFPGGISVKLCQDEINSSMEATPTYYSDP